MRTFWTLCLADFFVGMNIAFPITTLFLSDRGLSYTEMMWLESIFLLVMIISEIPTGVFGDRIGRKWSLVIGSLLYTLSLIPWFTADSFIEFAFAFGLHGLATAFYSGSNEAMAYDTLCIQGKKKEGKRYLGMYQSAIIAGTMVGALIGGILAREHVMSVYIFILLLTLITRGFSVLLYAAVPEPKMSTKGEKILHEAEVGIVHFGSGIALLKEDSQLRTLVLFSIFTMPFSYVLMYLYQPYFVASDVPNIWFGLAVTLSSLMIIMLRLQAHRIVDWIGRERGLIFICLLPGFIYAAMAFIVHPLWSVVLFMLNDSTGNLRDPIFSDEFNQRIPSHNRATVLSTISLLSAGFSVATRPLFGWLADIGLSYAFIAMALFVLVGTLIFGKQQLKSC